MLRVGELLDDPEFIKANSLEDTTVDRIGAQLDRRMAVEGDRPTESVSNQIRKRCDSRYGFEYHCPIEYNRKRLQNY